MTQKFLFSKKIIDQTLEFKVVGDLSSNNLSLILLHEGWFSFDVENVPRKYMIILDIMLLHTKGGL